MGRSVLMTHTSQPGEVQRVAHVCRSGGSPGNGEPAAYVPNRWLSRGVGVVRTGIAAGARGHRLGARAAGDDVAAWAPACGEGYGECGRHDERRESDVGVGAPRRRCDERWATQGSARLTECVVVEWKATVVRVNDDAARLLLPNQVRRLRTSCLSSPPNKQLTTSSKNTGLAARFHRQTIRLLGGGSLQALCRNSHFGSCRRCSRWTIWN